MKSSVMGIQRIWDHLQMKEIDIRDLGDEMS